MKAGRKNERAATVRLAPICVTNVPSDADYDENDSIEHPIISLGNSHTGFSEQFKKGNLNLLLKNETTDSQALVIPFAAESSEE